MRKKVLFVGNNPCNRQVAQAYIAREVCERLSDDGYEVHVAAFDQPLQNSFQPSEFKFKIYPIDPENTDDSVLQIVGKLRPDMVFVSHDCWRFPFFPRIKKEYPGIKIVGYFTIDGHPTHHHWTPILKACDHIIVPSKYAKKVLVHDHFYLEPKISVVPYGIDHEAFHYGKSDRVVSRKRFCELYDVDPTKKIFCFVGNNQFKKNIGVISDAWSKITQERDDVHLILATHSYMRKRGPWMFRGDFGLENFESAVTIIEKNMAVEEIAMIYQTADALLFPTQGEGFGYPPLEAMACGCIPIAPKFAAMEDYLNINNSISVDWIPIRGEFDVIRSAVVGDNLCTAIRDVCKGAYVCRVGYMIKTASQFSWGVALKEISETVNQVLNDNKFKYDFLEW